MEIGLNQELTKGLDQRIGQLNSNTLEECYTYDKRGNLTEIYQNNNLINQYHFGALNRLEKAVNHQSKEASEYIYNGLGHRVGKTIGAPIDVMLPTTNLEALTINPTKKIEDTIDLTKQYHNLLQRTENNNTTSFIWDSNVLRATNADNNNCSDSNNNDNSNSHNNYNQYLQDDLGSPIRLFSPSVDVEEIYSYDEFGQEIQLSMEGERVKRETNIIQPFTYTGYQNDNVANTYYAQAREYAPKAGRFTGEDIIKGNIVNPITMNHYMYFWNSPMSLGDLDGEKPKEFDGGNLIQDQENFYGSDDSVGLLGNVKNCGCGIVAAHNVGVITGNANMNYEDVLENVNTKAAKTTSTSLVLSVIPSLAVGNEILSNPAAVGGALGTNAYVLGKIVESYGYNTNWQFNLSKVSKDADVYIIMFFWYGGGFSVGGHYQAAYYDENGRLIVTNPDDDYADFVEFYNDPDNGAFYMAVMEINGGCDNN